jgi:hypothetical protein
MVERQTWPYHRARRIARQIGVGRARFRHRARFRRSSGQTTSHQRSVKRRQRARSKNLADPIPKWLLLQKLVTEEQLHQAFLAVANLPVAEAWQEAEVKRLLPILPPGFAVENHCYPLQETNGNLRIGLAQMPSEQVLREIYDRLAGYPICFQALSLADAAKLRTLAAAA